MAEGDITVHNNAKAEFGRGNIDLINDTIRVMLLNGWTPNIDTDDNWSDISANEVALANYSAGGQTLSTKTVTQNNTNNRGEFDCDNPVWSNLGSGSVNRGAIVKWTGVASTSTVIGNIELATNPNGQNYELAVNAEGLIHFT